MFSRIIVTGLALYDEELTIVQQRKSSPQKDSAFRRCMRNERDVSRLNKKQHFDASGVFGEYFCCFMGVCWVFLALPIDNPLNTEKILGLSITFIAIRANS